MSRPKLPSGLYTIKNVSCRNMVHLPDGDRGSLILTARPHESDARERWAITSIGNGNYVIRNQHHGFYAGVAPDLRHGSPVLATARQQEWLIYERRVVNQFVIATPDVDSLAWCFFSGKTGTNVELTTNFEEERNRWTLELVHGAFSSSRNTFSPLSGGIPIILPDYLSDSGRPSSPTSSFNSGAFGVTSGVQYSSTTQGFKSNNTSSNVIPSTSTKPNPIPWQPRPSLHRETKSKGGQISQADASPEELGRHRFGLDIKSIYYKREEGSSSVCCAILLTTIFQLPNSSLAHANVPIGVRIDLTPQTNHPAAGSISTTSLPRNPDSTLELAHFYPSEQQRRVIVPATQPLTLYPQRIEKSSDLTIPDIVKWTYTCPQTLEYPRNLNLIIIAEKLNCTEPWFGFTLHIRQDLFVDIHGPLGWPKHVLRFMAKSPPKGGSWLFKIKGEHHPERVKAMLEGQKNVDTLVGLKVEPGKWL